MGTWKLPVSLKRKWSTWSRNHKRKNGNGKNGKCTLNPDSQCDYKSEMKKIEAQELDIFHYFTSFTTLSLPLLNTSSSVVCPFLA